MTDIEQKDSERLRIVKMQLTELKSMLPSCQTGKGIAAIEDVKILLDKIINHVNNKTI